MSNKLGLRIDRRQREILTVQLEKFTFAMRIFPEGPENESETACVLDYFDKMHSSSAHPSFHIAYQTKACKVWRFESKCSWPYRNVQVRNLKDRKRR